MRYSLLSPPSSFFFSVAHKKTTEKQIGYVLHAWELERERGGMGRWRDGGRERKNNGDWRAILLEMKREKERERERERDR